MNYLLKFSILFLLFCNCSSDESLSGEERFDDKVTLFDEPVPTDKETSQNSRLKNITLFRIDSNGIKKKTGEIIFENGKEKEFKEAPTDQFSIGDSNYFYNSAGLLIKKETIDTTTKEIIITQVYEYDSNNRVVRYSFVREANLFFESSEIEQKFDYNTGGIITLTENGNRVTTFFRNEKGLLYKSDSEEKEEIATYQNNSIIELSTTLKKENKSENTSIKYNGIKPNKSFYNYVLEQYGTFENQILLLGFLTSSIEIPSESLVLSWKKVSSNRNLEPDTGFEFEYVFDKFERVIESKATHNSNQIFLSVYEYE